MLVAKEAFFFATCAARVCMRGGQGVAMLDVNDARIQSPNGVTGAYSIPVQLWAIHLFFVPFFLVFLEQLSTLFSLFTPIHTCVGWVHSSRRLFFMMKLVPIWMKIHICIRTRREKTMDACMRRNSSWCHPLSTEGRGQIPTFRRSGFCSHKIHL